MSEKFKEKWKRSGNSYSFIDTVSGRRVGLCFVTPDEGVREDEKLCDRIIEDHNACQGLARVDKIPLLIQNCESLLPLIQESHPTYYVSLKATIAQIKGAE